MGVKGPFGGIRPLADNKLEIEVRGDTIEVDLKQVGPLGAPRPFAHVNEAPTDEEIQECMEGETANAFARGMVEKSPFIDPRAVTREDVNELKRKYCEGTLSSIQEEAQEQFPPRPQEIESEVVEPEEIEGE